MRSRAAPRASGFLAEAPLSDGALADLPFPVPPRHERTFAGSPRAAVLPAGEPFPGSPHLSERERIRAAVARGSTIEQALDAEAHLASGVDSMTRLGRELRADAEGAGPQLQPLLELDGVSDVLVGAGQVWIDQGQGLRVAIEAVDETQMRALAVRMAASAGRRLDDAAPIVDATLADGTRLNAVLPPISADGTLICLRKPRRRVFSLSELVASSSLPADFEPVLIGLIRARASGLISGATGTGKTTLLAALLSLIPAHERIVCIEEASELHPAHPHVIHLQERGANVQGAGHIVMTALVRTALRMRPDRIVLGECRGAEVREMLSALNTGHEGGWGTIHANALTDIPARLTALGALADMSESTVAAQAASALDVVIHLRRLPLAQAGGQMQRVVDAIGVMERSEDGHLHCIPALARNPDGSVRALEGEPALRALLERGG